MGAIAKELSVKVHFAVEAAPEHLSYALLEADSQVAILGYLSQIPLRQDFKITPVMHTSDVVAFAKQMMSKMGHK